PPHPNNRASRGLTIYSSQQETGKKKPDRPRQGCASAAIVNQYPAGRLPIPRYARESETQQGYFKVSEPARAHNVRHDQAISQEGENHPNLMIFNTVETA
ncbi:hypothetical protein N5F07_00005, partial [Pseudomonas chengduensis]